MNSNITKSRENIGGIYDFLRKKKIENLKEIERKDKAKNGSITGECFIK